MQNFNSKLKIINLVKLFTVCLAVLFIIFFVWYFIYAFIKSPSEISIKVYSTQSASTLVDKIYQGSGAQFKLKTGLGCLTTLFPGDRGCPNAVLYYNASNYFKARNILNSVNVVLKDNQVDFFTSIFIPSITDFINQAPS